MRTLGSLISVLWVLTTLVDTSSGKYTPNTCCACDSLRPANTKAQPQVMPSPFKIIVNAGSGYDKGKILLVNLTSVQAGYQFRSFFLGAYKMPWSAGDNPIGELKLRGKQYSVRSACNNPIDPLSGNALISGDDDLKSNVEFEWKSLISVDYVEFRASFIVDDDIFWVQEKSSILEKKGADPLHLRKSIRGFDTSSCGGAKGCYREPADCIDGQCEYIVTWRPVQEGGIEFELGGYGRGHADRYVAVGFSEDIYMGNDPVFVCAHDSGTERTEVYLAYNHDDPKENERFRKYKNEDDGTDRTLNFKGTVWTEEGSYDSGIIRCRFVVDPNLSKFDSRLESLRGSPKHLLLANGYAVRGQPKRHGLSVEDLPLASADKIHITESGNHNDRARYPLAKAHAILMIIAWIFFASIGLLLTKYYKTMWPNSRLFGQRYWFIGHFNFMAMMFIISIIAIIIIFIEADGWSEAPELPQKAHPILGIIILVCIIINPILGILINAFFSPWEEHECRPVMNWIHWIFGTVANILAIPQIFIGMDFGKVMVPWWATWILVIWVIFHIAVELSLEIHQCCTYKKNKERRKKYEALKREFPKQHHLEPEPAGRRFKRFMLFLHIGVTTLITLIMVIIIAVS